MAKGFGNDWRGLSPNDPRIKSVTGQAQSFPSGESIRPKFNNKRTQTADGIWCDSKKEAARWAQLKALEAAGHIRDLLPHPAFPLYTNGTKTGRITFDSLRIEGGMLVVEDVKSGPTARGTAFRQRFAQFRACYPHIDAQLWFG